MQLPQNKEDGRNLSDCMIANPIYFWQAELLYLCQGA